MSKCPESKKLSRRNAQELINTLVKNYPVHECVIGREEAKGLGLPIYNAEENDMWPHIKKEYNQFMKNNKTVLELIESPPPPKNKNTQTVRRTNNGQPKLTTTE